MKKQGVSKSGYEWTCLIDRTGFHFSMQNGDFILYEFVDEQQLTKDDFYEIVNKIDYEMSGYGKELDEENKLLPVDNVEEMPTMVEEQVCDGAEDR